MAGWKVDWYVARVERENSERSDDEDVELSVSNSSCSSTLDARGFDARRHHFTLVISARSNAVARRLADFRSQLSAAGARHCDVRCRLETAVTTIVNQSRPVIDRCAS